MFKFSRKAFLAMAISCTFLTPAMADFTKEKELIDAHSPTKFRGQIRNVAKFALDTIEAKNDPRFEKALHQLGMKTSENPPEVDEGFDYSVVLGGLFLLDELTKRENPDGVDVIEAGEVASLLLTPEVFPKDFAYPNQHILNKSVLQRRNRFYLASIYQQKGADEETLEKIKKSLFNNRGPRDQNSVIAKHFDPIILIGDDSVFTDEGYVYGLSKGKLLHGLPKVLQHVHGGTITRPAEVFAHDQAHNNDILMPNDQISDETYGEVTEVIKTLAARFYELINNPEVFSREERAKALHAAAFLFHENQIEKSTENLSLPHYSLRKKLDIIRKRFDITFQSYFNVSGSPKPPSTLSEKERRMNELMAQFKKEDEFRDSFHYLEKFASDSAKQICEFYPEAEIEIFGTETDIDRNYVYHGENALKWNMKLINWFYDKVKNLI